MNKKGPYRPRKQGSRKPAAPKKPTQDGIRLNKYIANSGICSRREADVYIATGLVAVNGKIVNEMGYRVKPGDEVKFDGRTVNPEPKTFILLNKPKGVPTTPGKSSGITAMDIVARASTPNVKPFGRLGRNATGLLLLTNDEDFRQKFMRKGLSRLFHVELDKNLKAEHLERIRNGVEVNGREIHSEEVSYVENAPKKEVGIRLKHTGNSVIRDLFHHLGYDVVRVDCVAIGPLTKKDLPRGRFRTLNDKEMRPFDML